MSIATFRKREITEQIETFAKTDSMVALVGAGASVEARLPTWEGLVRNLLSRSADLAPSLNLSEEQKKAWIDRTIKADSLLGAAAIADSLIDPDLEELLEQALYGKGGAGSYRPGPTLKQLARLRNEFGDQLILITTNYDDLLEQALDSVPELEKKVTSYVDPDFRPSVNEVAVFHPHGFAGEDGREGPFVLTEQDYQRLEKTQQTDTEATIGVELRQRPCLFIGASLNDANLLRYIYRFSRGNYPHAVLFVRQAEYDEADVEHDLASSVQNERVARAVRKARHTATKARWEKRNVTPIFLDHFSDVSYFLHEVAYCRKVGVAEYKSLAARSEEWLRLLEGRLFNRADGDEFRKGQKALNKALRTALGEAQARVDSRGRQDGLELDWDKERLAMTLWLTSPSGTHLTDVATTDRLHYDPKTIEPRKLDPRSRWISVKAVLGNRKQSASRDIYASRWRYVVGLPLDIETPSEGILPVGCLTVSSMVEGKDTVLATLPDSLNREFCNVVRSSMARFLLGSARAQVGKKTLVT